MLAEQKANELAARLGKAGLPKATCADPLTILALLSVILSAIQLLYTCRRTPAAMAKRARNLGWIDRWRLGRLVWHETRKRDGLAQHSGAIFAELEKMAKETPPHQFMAILRESRQTHL